MEQPGRPLTLTEVAHQLNVHPKTVRRMILRGEFPEPRYVGGSPRWFADDVSYYLYRLRRGEVGNNPPPAAPRKDKKPPLRKGQEGTSAD